MLLALFVTLFLLAGIIALIIFFGWFALASVLWIVVKLPIALFMFVIGLVMCCTIILIPLGMKCMGTAFRILI